MDFCFELGSHDKDPLDEVQDADEDFVRLGVGAFLGGFVLLEDVDQLPD